MADVAMTFSGGVKVHFLISALHSQTFMAFFGMLIAAVGFCAIYEFASFQLKKKENQYVESVRGQKIG